ncbi:hypothetical protein [Thermus hydrothermalis]|nr:hypothetical protein [Thermus hydrothermalis]
MAWSLDRGLGEEPAVYALTREGKVVALLTPKGPIAVKNHP